MTQKKLSRNMVTHRYPCRTNVTEMSIPLSEQFSEKFTEHFVSANMSRTRMSDNMFRKYLTESAFRKYVQNNALGGYLSDIMYQRNCVKKCFET